MNDSGKKAEPLIDRRELFKKYGPYTAPLVIAMLSPETAYSHNSSDVYSTSAKCVADSSGGNMHGPTMTGHCMINGASGGGQAHTVTDPGPA